MTESCIEEGASAFGSAKADQWRERLAEHRSRRRLANTNRCPAKVVDLSLRHSRVGMGSFDETGDFRNVKITGEAKDSPALGRQ